MTVYLVDADVLIRAHEDYYPVDRVAPFWAWLHQQALAGRVKMTKQNYEEISRSKGLLADLLRQPAVRDALELKEATDVAAVRRVIDEGYAPNMSDVDVEKIGRDPFLIAAALIVPSRVIVTREVSKPSKQGANRKIPDVCRGFGITCINDYALWRLLDFKIE